MSVPRHTILGIVGPANSGKTTLLKTINRTIEFISGAKVEGEVFVEGEEVRAAWLMGSFGYSDSWSWAPFKTRV